jgi:formate/nitrite transporter FocA (FNT family)
VAYASEHIEISNTTLLEKISLIFTIVFVFAGTANQHIILLQMTTSLRLASKMAHRWAIHAADDLCFARTGE